MTRSTLAVTLETLMFRSAEGGSVNSGGGGKRETLIVARSTRRSRKLRRPWSRSMSDRTRASSRSMLRISLTLVAFSSSDRRLCSLRRALLCWASRSMKSSLTSSLPRSWSRSLPSASRRPRAARNWSCGTRRVMEARRSSSLPDRDICSTKPPRLSAMTRAWAAASWTASTSREMKAVEMTLRSAVSNVAAVVSAPGSAFLAAAAAGAGAAMGSAGSAKAAMDSSEEPNAAQPPGSRPRDSLRP